MMTSWASGGFRPGSRSGRLTIFSMAKAALAFVNMAPFGGPVVPDV